MWYKKKGLPEETDLVFCTVTKILPHSVFARIEEYQNLDGLIHISEITPGRVRNIRDFVKEGKKLVCKVLRVNEKGQVDLSLRRVALGQRKSKLEEIQREEKAEKLLESVGLKSKLKVDDMYKKVGFALIDKHGSLSEAFQLLVDKETDWSDIKADDKIKKELSAVVKEKIKPPEVSITGTFTLVSMDSEGVEIIKSTLKDAEDFASKKKFKMNLSYLSAPKYKVVMFARDFKTAEKQLTQVVDSVSKAMKKSGGTVEFVR